MIKLKKKVKRETDEYSLTKELFKFIGGAYQDLLETMHRHHAKGFHMSSDITLPRDAPRYCLRKIEIERRWSDKLEKGYHDGGLQFTFDVGSAIHHVMHNYLAFMGYRKTQGLYGRWKCVKCRKQWFDFCIKPCPFCKAKVKYVQYREYPFFNKRYDILSTTDGLWWYKKGNVWYEDIVEFKSIKDNANYAGEPGYAELMGPKGHHSNQAEMYFFLRQYEREKGLKRKLPDGLKEWPRPGGIRVIYINKNSQFTIKEYAYTPANRNVWNMVTKRITIIRKHEASGRYAKKTCGTIQDGKKKGCPVRDVCFGKLAKK